MKKKEGKTKDGRQAIYHESRAGTERMDVNYLAIKEDIPTDPSGASRKFTCAVDIVRRLTMMILVRKQTGEKTANHVRA